MSTTEPVKAALNTEAAAKACPIARTDPITCSASTGRAARLPARCSRRNQVRAAALLVFACAMRCWINP